MKRQISVCVAVLAMSLAACGGGGDIDDFVKLDTEKGKAFEVGGDDCAAKAEAVGEWRKNNAKKYSEMRKALGEKYKDGPPEAHKEQLQTNKKAVMGAMMKCTNDLAFSKMMDETKI